MTDHPAIAAGCTSEEIAVFEALTINDVSGHDPDIISSLYALGLIDFAVDLVAEGDGVAKIATPYVPVQHHFAFCTWASEQPEFKES